MAIGPVEEATRRSGVVWLGTKDHAARVAWHVWHDGAAWLVTGGAEQWLPGVEAGATVTVTVRSKATQNDQVVTWSAAVSAVPPGSAEWEAVVPLLHAARLNAPDGEDQPARWARESAVLRLSPLP